MSYRLVLTPKAHRHFTELPDEFVEVVRENLYVLAASPTSLSQSIASPPFAPHGQLYHFNAVGFGGSAWFFTVIFLYSQDETTLHVLIITWRELIEE